MCRLDHGICKTNAERLSVMFPHLHGRLSRIYGDGTSEDRALTGLPPSLSVCHWAGELLKLSASMLKWNTEPLIEITGART